MTDNPRIRVLKPDGTEISVEFPDELARLARALPYDPERYFTRPVGVLILPLRRLTQTRARPDGVRNAVRLMRQAYDGQIDRRAPVQVQQIGGASYLVLDGNSTVTIAVLAGWPDIPCLVEHTPS